MTYFGESALILTTNPWNSHFQGLSNQEFEPHKQARKPMYSFLIHPSQGRSTSIASQMSQEKPRPGYG